MTCSTNASGCMCRDDLPNGQAISCTETSVAVGAGEVGVCCDGFWCRCEAYVCKNDSNLGYCACGPSYTITGIVGGSLVTTCPLPTGSQKCCYSPDLNDCTCSTSACSNGRIQVATCSIGDVTICRNGDARVGACSVVAGTGGASGRGGAGGTAGAAGAGGSSGRGGASGGAGVGGASATGGTPNSGGSSGQGGVSGSGGRGAMGGGGIAGGGAGTGGVAALTSLLWVRHSPGATLSGTSGGDSVAALSGGDILVTGSYANNIRFGAGESTETTFTLPVSNAVEGYVARYRGDGSFAGASRIPGAGSTFVASLRIAPTADGGFVLTGNGTDPITLASGEASEKVIHAGGFVARFAADGSLTWAKPFEGYAAALVESATGGVVAAGSFARPVTVANGTSTPTTITPLSEDMFVARFEADDALSWIVTGGTPRPNMSTSTICRANSVALVGDRILVAGDFWQSMTLQPGLPSTRVLAGGTNTSNDIFFLTLQADGTVASATRIGGNKYAARPLLAARPDGTVLMAGLFGGTIMLGQGTTPTALTSPQQSVFIARFDPSGALAWSDQINFDPGTYVTVARLLAGPSGAVHLLGSWGGGLATFSPGKPEARPAFASGSYFLAGYAADGRLNRLSQSSSPGATAGVTAADASLTPDGSVAFTGRVVGTQTFDVPVQPTFIASPMQSMFVARAR